MRGPRKLSGTRSRRRRAPVLERLTEYSALLAEVGRVTAEARDEPTMLRAICELAARRAELGLVWVGVPDGSGHLAVAAAAGAVGYLDGILVSVQDDSPQGQGPSGRAWREGLPQYVASIADDAAAEPWRERAAQHGLTGIVTMRVERSGRPWGILTFYLTAGRRFSADVRLVLEDIARTLSSGLDRLDSVTRERELAEVQSLLLDQAAAGIALARKRRIAVVNRHLAEMLGYGGPQELIGRSTRVVYATREEYIRVGKAYRTLHRRGSCRVANVRLVRRDGRELVSDVQMSLLRGQDFDTVVWTIYDVTDRVAYERKLEREVESDALTGLPNRRGLERHLAAALEQAQRRGTALAVGMLDLDDMARVNARLGHEAADRVLRTFSDRLSAELRSGEYLARYGGDTFVLVLGDLDRSLAAAQLQRTMRRVHVAVEEPFEPTRGERFFVEISLGVAVFPEDGRSAPDLLVKADGILSDVKAHKHDRAQWWQLASAAPDAEPATEAPFDPYGAEAAELLAGTQDLFRLAAEYVRRTLAGLAEGDPDLARILSGLAATSQGRRAATRNEQLDFLFEPSSSRRLLEERSRSIGRHLSLAGVEASLLYRAVALYRDCLTARLGRTLMSARDRYRLLLVAERRLQDHLAGQLAAMQGVGAAYFAAVSAPLPEGRVRRVDSLRDELEALGRLPGVMAAALARPDPYGGMVVEHSSGELADAVERLLHQGRSVSGNDDEAGGTEFWQDEPMLRVSNFAADPRFAGWRVATDRFGIGSLLAVPLRDPGGHVTAVVCIFGRYANQFEPQPMQQFAQSLARRWEELWRRASQTGGAVALSRSEARAYRQRLFSGGLSMYLQPIVNLGSGRLEKVEALARLVQADGSVVPPGAFLPLLGDVELAGLFRQGLHEALGHLAGWRRAGHSFGVAVNLPPTTLLQPDCDRWVAEELARHDVEPSSVTLELLETTLVDEAARDAAIARLARLGVRLAIDDLGAGYSSLRRLCALPFHTVKIDQQLLRRLRDEPPLTFAVIDAVIELGRRVGREVVVEGLEDPDAIEVASVLGAPLGQGYGIGMPMPARDLVPWLETFTLPIEAGRIHSYLGALAWHWKHGHAHALDRCPLTSFLEGAGRSADQARRLHARIHAANGRSNLHEELGAWLTEHMQAERLPDQREA